MRSTRLLIALMLAGGCRSAEPAVPADPMITAVREGRVADVLAALDGGASPNQQSPEGALPLVEAARLGHDTIVAELLAAGADPQLADSAGINAWDAVMTSGHAGVADRLIRDAALDAGAGPAVLAWFDGVRRTGAAPPRWQEVLNGELLPLGMMYAALHDRSDLIATMRRGREIPNRTGYHALTMAARWGRDRAVAALLAIDVHPDVESARRTTALMEAARDGRITVARQLLGAGADPNHPDRHGETPLHWAVRFGQSEYAGLLRSAGGDPSRRNVSGQTPADVTLEDGRLP